MTSERDKCGLTSLLPLSCRDRAEAFARSLQSRLNSLGSHDGSTEERSWLGVRESTIALSQPLHTDAERYLALDLLESPNSPQEEIGENDLNKLLNGNERKTNGECSNGEIKCNGLVRHCSADSDTEVFYDIEEDDDPASLTEDLAALSLNEEPECIVNGNSRLTEEAANEEDDEITPRVRRCSSLKTGKTPPDTPSRKKIVRFADVLGLDLADVRTFLDEIPKVPKSAYDDLSDVDLSDSTELLNNLNGTKFHGVTIDRILVPLFEQPAGNPKFLDLVRDRQVCLENALVEDPILFLIKGTVRVRNLDFHKSVHIRYSLDSWRTFVDVQATYEPNSCDGFSDRFAFTIYAHTLTVGQKIEFACRFQCKGSQYWDSNGGKNYGFQCLPATTNNTTAPIVEISDWGASFY